ncbi:MAG: 4Fe-4S ferredoxin [Clostridiales bacterium]|nr:4Fe-4S ferredoxin [Clostridiales bacterium]
MIRRIIRIDSEKCNGCAMCADACHEGAIGMVEGKAVLLRDDYCDGLGDCLPVCPTGAITFEEREALEYDEAEVKKNIGWKEPDTLPCGCPGTNAKALKRAEPEAAISASDVPSQLNQWPVQIKLVPINAPYFNHANLLIAADCAAYAYGNFHRDFMKNCITLIGCPKLDDVDYSEKLTDILAKNDINSVTLVRMQVPCCGGIENATKKALLNSKKTIPLKVAVISTDGKLLTDSIAK